MRVSISIAPKLSLQWFLHVLRNTEMISFLLMMTIHTVCYTQHFSSRGVPGRRTAARMRVSAWDGWVHERTSHSERTATRSSTCSNTPHHHQLQSTSNLLRTRWHGHVADLSRTEWWTPRPHVAQLVQLKTWAVATNVSRKLVKCLLLLHFQTHKGNSHCRSPADVNGSHTPWTSLHDTLKF